MDLLVRKEEMVVQVPLRMLRLNPSLGGGRGVIGSPFIAFIEVIAGGCLSRLHLCRKGHDLLQFQVQLPVDGHFHQHMGLLCSFGGEIEMENLCRNEKYMQITFLKPCFTEFMHIFSSFPKTDIYGYIYIIKLSAEILNEKALLRLQDALQYSLSGGQGLKLYENVKFFGSESQKVPMKIHSHQCPGTTQLFVMSNIIEAKACEFLAA